MWWRYGVCVGVCESVQNVCGCGLGCVCCECLWMWCVWWRCGVCVCVSPLHTYLCFTHLCAASFAWLRCSFQRRLPASLKHLVESGARAAHLGAHPLYTQQVWINHQQVCGGPNTSSEQHPGAWLQKHWGWSQRSSPGGHSSAGRIWAITALWLLQNRGCRPKSCLPTWKNQPLEASLKVDGFLCNLEKTSYGWWQNEAKRVPSNAWLTLKRAYEDSLESATEFAFKCQPSWGWEQLSAGRPVAQYD